MEGGEQTDNSQTSIASNPRPSDGCSKNNNNIGDYSNSFYGRWRVGGGGRKEQREMLLSFPLLLRCPSVQTLLPSLHLGHASITGPSVTPVEGAGFDNAKQT